MILISIQLHPKAIYCHPEIPLSFQCKLIASKQTYTMESTLHRNLHLTNFHKKLFIYIQCVWQLLVACYSSTFCILKTKG